MTLLRYLLIFTGIGLLVGAMTILIWDLYQIFKWRKNSLGGPQPGLRWYTSRRLATLCVLPLLAGLSIAVVPSGWAGVRVNQFLGTRPATLYPGVHLIFPLIEQLELDGEFAPHPQALRRLLTAAGCSATGSRVAILKCGTSVSSSRSKGSAPPESPAPESLAWPTA